MRQRTLTGFEIHETPDQWRAYVERLHAARTDLLDQYRKLKASQRLNFDQHRFFWSRYDVLSEHIDRAKAGMN